MFEGVPSFLVSTVYPFNPLIGLLNCNGKLILLGAGAVDVVKPIDLAVLLTAGRKLIEGSNSRGLKEMQEMIDFCSGCALTVLAFGVAVGVCFVYGIGVGVKKHSGVAAGKLQKGSCSRVVGAEMSSSAGKMPLHRRWSFLGWLVEVRCRCRPLELLAMELSGGVASGV